MLTTEFSIPVSVEVDLADVLQGIFEIEGLLNYADETLTIEIQRKELLSRGSKVKTVDIPLDALREVVFRRKLIAGSKIELKPKRLSAFDDVPVSSAGQIVLKVKRPDRDEAEALVDHLQRVITYRSAPDKPAPIPFKGSDAGLREIKGTIYTENDEFLVLDVKNALIGDFDKQHQVIKVAPKALHEIRLEPHRFRDRLYIRPKGQDLLDAMPGSHKGRIELKIRPEHREEVERLIYELTRMKSRNAAPAEDRDKGAA